MPKKFPKKNKPKAPVEQQEERELTPEEIQSDMERREQIGEGEVHSEKIGILRFF